MPNIVMKWDFEDGTTQGWSLGAASLDSSGALQGTYSLKYSRSVSSGYDYSDLIASISNIDLSNVSKPILVIMLRDDSNNSNANASQTVRVVVKDASTTYVDLSIIVASVTTGYYRVIVFDLSPAAGRSGLTIQIYDSYSVLGPSGYYTYTVVRYYDNIMILDGADYEYNTGVVAFDKDDKTITLSIPSTVGDLSSLNPPKMAVSLMTPGWNYYHVSVTATHNKGSLGIDSSNNNIIHANYASYGTAPTAFQSVSIRVWKWSIGAYAGWREKVAVAFLDNSWNLLRLYVFNIYFTANGVSPRFINAVTTATYGTLVSGSKSFSVKIYGNAFDVALRVKYIYGDRTVVTSGTVKLEVFSSDLSTKYGEASVDITTANDQVTSYITGLPTSTDLVVRVSWTIQANARIVLLAYPLLRVY